MSLSIDVAEARKADAVNSSITETGKYIGVITRAEKLLSKNNVEGFGLSFKADDGSTANYLDLYTVNSAGVKLRGLGFVQAILVCTKTKTAEDGVIKFDKWDSAAGKVSPATATGYPALMGKRIGLILEKELSTNTKTGKDVTRVNVAGVFEADTELTASEILDKKTQPEQLEKMFQVITSRPVRDTRAKSSQTSGGQVSQADHDAFNDFADDIPF